MNALYSKTQTHHRTPFQKITKIDSVEVSFLGEEDSVKVSFLDQPVTFITFPFLDFVKKDPKCFTNKPSTSVQLTVDRKLHWLLVSKTAK